MVGWEICDEWEGLHTKACDGPFLSFVYYTLKKEIYYNI